MFKFRNLLNRLLIKYGRSSNKFMSDGYTSPNDEQICKSKAILVDNIIKLLKPSNPQSIVDMTFGAGGHSKAILKEFSDLVIYALDRDPAAFEMAKELSQQLKQIKPLNGLFSEIKKLLKSEYQITKVDAVLLDAGVSPLQFDYAERGFSLNKDGPLDMRMNGQSNADEICAYDVINLISEVKLYEIIKKYGEEKNAKMIARAIINHRHINGPISSTSQLAQVVSTAFNNSTHYRNKLNRHAHLATKTFQAIRIIVNNELNELNMAMNNMYDILKPGGLCIVLTFHSLEDRIVKMHFHGRNTELKQLENTLNKSAYSFYEVSDLDRIIKEKWTVVDKKVIVPTFSEISSNPRARSVKLRSAIKNKI